MPGDSLHLAPRDRLLSDSGLRAVDSDRHPVVGVLLDQRRVVAGTRLHRPAQRAHDGDAELRHQPDASARLLHQGDRRVDDRLPRVRVLRAARIRLRQRGHPQRRPDTNADRAHRLAATDGRQ